MDITRRTEKKQNDILNAAISLFLQYGVRKTSMDEIARKAQASKVTVYKYFIDKDTLCRQVYARLSSEYEENLNMLVSTVSPVAEKMIRFTGLVADFVSSGYHALCEELSFFSGSLRESFVLLQQKQSEIIRQLIIQAKQARLIYSDLEDDDVFHYIQMGICYYKSDTIYRDKIQRDPNFRERFMKLLWRNIFSDSTSFQCQDVNGYEIQS